MRRFLWIFLVGLSAIAPPVHAQTLTTVNIASEAAPALAGAVRELGLAPQSGSAKAATFGGPLVVWEAMAGGGSDISPATAQALGEYVRQGGSLLLTLGNNPGAGPFRLSFLLPTTAWHTQGGQSQQASQHSGSLSLAEADPHLFPAGTVSGLTVPFYFPLRPFHAVERGEARYERFARSIPYLDLPVPADNSFWTRPLINRDWEIRARGDDVGQTPLLLTGRYGAGRVAVFASSVKGMADSPAARAFWTPVLRWLTTREDATATPGSPAGPVHWPSPAVTVDRAAHTLRVTVQNPTGRAVPVQVLARLLTWEHALVGDLGQRATVPANGQITVALPLPESGATSYQALDFREAYIARLGVLSVDGATALNESKVPVEVRLPLTLQVETDNLRAVTYPFTAPGPGILDFPSRMGATIDSYAYAPGQALNARVTIKNGAHNLAPLATVRDETKPDNASAAALNDEAMRGEQGPIDTIQAYGMWTGQAGQENDLSFSFPAPVTVSGVTLVGSPDSFRYYLDHNPGAVVVEADGKEVSRADDLDQKFVDGFGRVRLVFAPQKVTTLRVRLPWVNTPISGQRRRQAPWLGDISIEGTTEALPKTVQGTVSFLLRDALTGTATPLGTRDVTVEPGASAQLQFPVTVPRTDDAPHFYSLEASFAGQRQSAPVMVLQPGHPLVSMRDLKPLSAVDEGFIVTRGFRNVFTTGTGTAEIPPGWATPDDLIWAYAHQMKQLGPGSRTQANRLFVTENDMRHYSTPWRNFANGEYFYDVAPEALVQQMKRDRRWKEADRVILAHSDRWDSAPDIGALNGWQDFIGFDEYLQAQGLPGLTGHTRQELATEIHTGHESRWMAWQLDRYIHAVDNLRAAFGKEGKNVIITAQGSPLVPAKYEKQLTGTIRGQSDDSTWAMEEENVPLSVGRQMGILAFNPGWAMSTLIQWGWDSAVLNNPHWHQPVGTTEPSRRHLYDRAWRGTIGWNGQYHSMHTYGYNQNGGVSYTMTRNDWQQWWNVEERQSLIGPEAPLGAGIIISTSRFDDPDHTSWSGSGGNGNSEADKLVQSVQSAVRSLQEAGLSIPFAANAGTLDAWKGMAPLVLLDVNTFNAREIAAVAAAKARGSHVVAFQGEGPLSEAAAKIFGVSPDGSPTTGRKVGELDGRPLVANGDTLLIPGKSDSFSVPDGRSLAALMEKTLALPITFPRGTAGYGFVSQGRKFIVVEDWREEGRTVTLKVKAAPGATGAHAVNVNSHEPLAVRRDGADWSITLPLRPGDGTLVAVEESQ